MTKHTQGPWEYSENNGLVDKYGHCIQFSGAALSTGGGDKAIPIANSRLASTAPDGYPLAKMVVAVFNHPEIDWFFKKVLGDTNEAALALIAKADGKETS